MLLHGRTAALPAAVCAISLGIALSPVSWASGPSRGGLPGGCGPVPSWIAVVTLQGESQGPLPSCFSARSNQAEAVLSIANNRPYAQLITVTGAALDLAESSFASPLEGALSTLLAKSSPAAGPSAVLLGAEQIATLTIDRPAPGGAQVVHIAPAGDNAFAVAAVTWRFLSAAASRGLLSTATRGCVASVLRAALQVPPAPERALRRVHACVEEAELAGHAETLLRGLASRLLRDDFFQSVIEREGRELRPARIALAFAASNPELINPDIKLGPPSLQTVPAGRRTVEHLSATGGTPPYRFYAVAEAGGPGVPAWLQLAPDGTLTLEPPLGVSAITLSVEVVDRTGEHSVVFS